MTIFKLLLLDCMDWKRHRRVQNCKCQRIWGSFTFLWRHKFFWKFKRWSNNWSRKVRNICLKLFLKWWNNFREIVISHLQIIDIPDSLQQGEKTSPTVLQPVKKEMIEKRQNISDKPKDYSSVKGPKLDDRTDNFSVVGPTKKSGRLITCINIEYPWVIY